MNLLALEFSSDRRSAAVASHGIVLAEVHVLGVRTTSAPDLIAGALQNAGLQPSQIDRLAVGIGPGSYTGIRRAIATLQGWHLANRTPVVPVGSFDILARMADAELRRPCILVADAQRQEWACAHASAGRLTSPIQLHPRSTVESWIREGQTVVSPDPGLPGALTMFPSASIAAQIAADLEPIPAESLAALYLREAAFIKAPAHRNLDDLLPPIPTKPV